MSWARELGNVGRELFGPSEEAALPPEPLPNELLLATSGGANQPVYGEPAALEEHVPGGGGPSGAAHRVPGGGVSALHHLEADLLLVGTEAGAVLAYQLHPSAAADDGSWDRCEPLGAAAVARAAVAQIATAGAAASHAFVLCGGALVALRHALRQQPPLLERASALPIGKVLAMAVRAPSEGSYLAEAGAAATVCAATAGAILVYTFNGTDAGGALSPRQHFQLRSHVALPAALPAVRSLCWAGDEALVVADGAQRLQWASLPPAPLHNAEVLPEDARLEPLLAPSESPASSSGCALALRVTPSEVLLVGGGAHTAVVAVGVPHGRRTRRVGYLQGPPARNATLAWPHLLCATGSTLRVFDLQLGSLAQSLKLAAPPAPRASSASASSSSSSAAASRSLRVSAFGRHELVLARGDVLFTLAPLAATEAQGERRWLRKVSERPWDAVLVDAHVSQSLSLPAHPLTTALSLLAAAFAATFGKKRSPLLSTAFPTPRGIDGIGGAGKDDALCAAACAAARCHAARLQSEALLLLPALAPRFGYEAAHGAAGEALLQAVERAASGAMQRTLVGLFAERTAAEQQRYVTQLHLMAKVQPHHLRLPQALCEPPPPLSDGSKAPPLYSASIKRLQQLAHASSPVQMLAGLVETCRLLAQEAQQAGAPPPSADELMPLTAYVMLKAQLGSLPAQLALLQAMYAHDNLFGEQGYCLATFQVAYVWSMQLKWDQLHHPGTRGEPAAPVAQGAKARRPSSAAAAAGGGAARPSSGKARRPSERPAPRPTTAAGGDGAAAASIADSMELLRRLEMEASGLTVSTGSAGSRGSGGGGGSRGGGRSSGGSRSSAAPETRSELLTKSVGELLAIAKRRGVDCSSAVEKADLVTLLGGPPPPPSAVPLGAAAAPSTSSPRPSGVEVSGSFRGRASAAASPSKSPGGSPKPHSPGSKSPTKSPSPAASPIHGANARPRPKFGEASAMPPAPVQQGLPKMGASRRRERHKDSSSLRVATNAMHLG